MNERFFIPKPTTTDQIETVQENPLASCTSFSIYVNERGQSLKWSGDFPLPEIGSRVYVVMNQIGWAIVKGYFENDGWLGVMTLPSDPPKWLRDQQKEEQRDPEYAKRPQWVKEGVGCEFGAEVRLLPPRLKEAIRLLGIYTSGRFDVWMLAGSANTVHRAQVLSALRGRRVPTGTAGVLALQADLYDEAGVDGDCEADRGENFVAYCKGLLL